ncbi:tyrosine-protein phosphatase Lar-like isoform X2 [Oscarella lobularis]|uniref:tyrosine-protein phosphatase Lar-like isoform X2 n=1 Tax=Oscarella lobularis TaxID=121494 RepID=UPI003313721C
MPKMLNWATFLSPFLFLCLHACWCNGATISPPGSLTGLDGENSTINCSFPDGSGAAAIRYNQKLSAAVFVASGDVTPISVPPFKGTALGLGLSTVQGVRMISFRLKFTLKSDYNGASLRCRFRASDGSTTESQPLTLVVLSSPCCTVSNTSHIVHNTTSRLRLLSCEEIISHRGNPPANVSWSKPSGGCVGTESGDANQFYDLHPVTRQCNNAQITCVADTKEPRLDTTMKTFALTVNSQPERVQCSYDGLTRPRALFSWEMPGDDGGFPITDYDLSLSINGVTQSLIAWTLGRPLRSDHVVNDSDTLVFRVSAMNTLGPGEACQVDQTVPTRKCIKPVRSAGSRSALTIDCQTDTDFNSGGYIVYYTRNGMQEASQSQNSLPITILNLAEDTAYDIVVEARNSEGTRENSTVVSMRTNLPGVPGSPIISGNANALNITSTSFILTFSSVLDSGRDNASVSIYRVFLNSDQRDMKAQSGETQAFLIEKLSPSTTYTVKVLVINSLGEESEESRSITVTTLEEEKKGGLSSGAIVGIAVAASLLVIAIIVIICWVKHNSSKNEDAGAESSRNESTIEDKRPRKSGGDGIQYAELELAQAGSTRVKENRFKDAVTYSDVKPAEATQYAQLDLAKQTPEKEEKNLKKVKKAKEEESVPYTGVTKLADH